MGDIRLGLLGAGPWGRRYISTIRALPGTRLAVLASRNPESATLAPPDCKIFADWREAVNAPDVDALIVATPPRLHTEMAVAIIDAGRPVLIEKPMTLSRSDARRIEDQAAKSGVLAMVGHTQLFNSAFRELKGQLPKIGAIRRVRSMSGNWGPFRTDLSPLWDYAPHDVAMCMDLFNRTPQRLAAQRERHGRFEGGIGETYRLDLDFAGGVAVQIVVGNTIQPKCRRFVVSGTEGELIFDDLAPSKLMLRRDGTEAAMPYDPELPLTTEVREFAGAVREGRRSDPSLALGRAVVDVLARCDEMTGTD